MRTGREKSSLPALVLQRVLRYSLGGTSHNGFKRFCEITGAGKTAAVANINDTLFPGIQHMTGFFNPVMDQVLNGRLLDDVVEGTLYFPFTDIGSLRQLF